MQHPFVNDPLRPGKVDRVIAASFGFGSTQTFQTEMDAYRNYPQVVIALKNAYHKFLKEGIAPIAASGQFGAPLGASGPTTTSSAEQGAVELEGPAQHVAPSRGTTMPTTAPSATSTECRFQPCSTR